MILFLCCLALFIAFTGYLVYAHNQPLILPAPTGPYSVGRTEYDWTDGNRTDLLAGKPTEKRELLVWIWYPSSAAQQNSAAPYLPPAWAKAYEDDAGIGKYLERDFSSIRTHSFLDTPPAGANVAYPVILMLPGMGPAIPDYTVLAENLASHGYVVAGINPTGTSNLIVFPDGRIVLRSALGQIPDNADAATIDQEANRIETVWASDLLFVLDKLQAENANSSSRFYGKLDLAHLGIFGHSFGGATSLRVCEIDPRCKAGADLDGTIFSEDTKRTVNEPFLFMTEDDCGKDCDTMHLVYSTATNRSYYLSVKGTKHFNFSDRPLRLTPPALALFRLAGFIGSIQPARGLEITNAYLAGFFDRYLKGINSDIIQGSSPAYPEVQLESR